MYSVFVIFILQNSRVEFALLCLCSSHRFPGDWGTFVLSWKFWTLSIPRSSHRFPGAWGIYILFMMLGTNFTCVFLWSLLRAQRRTFICATSQRFPVSRGQFVCSVAPRDFRVTRVLRVLSHHGQVSMRHKIYRSWFRLHRWRNVWKTFLRPFRHHTFERKAWLRENVQTFMMFNRCNRLFHSIFGQHVFELIFGVNIFDLDLGI